MKKSGAMLALLLAAMTLAAAKVETYPVYHAPVSPLVDGEIMGDPAWQAIPEVTGFHVLGGGYTIAKQSVVRLCWDAEALYVGFMAEEPDAALLKPTAKDGGAPWGEDSIEVFLQPRPPGGQAYQLGVTAGGGQGSGAGYPDITKTTAAAHIGADFYSIELRVPWSAVGATAQAGDQWRGTVCRNIFTTQSGGDKYTCMSALQRQFLEPESFSLLVFKAEVLDVADAKRMAEELNRPYRQTLETEVKRLAGERPNYAETLQSALEEVTYGEEARELLRRWEALTELSQLLGQAPLNDLRQGLVTSRDLSARSHELKYRILLQQLLLD